MMEVDFGETRRCDGSDRSSYARLYRKRFNTSAYVFYTLRYNHISTDFYLIHIVYGCYRLSGGSAHTIRQSECVIRATRKSLEHLQHRRNGRF